MKKNATPLKVDGQLTINLDLGGERPVEITIDDKDASITVAVVKISNDKFIAALGRMACVPCELEIGPTQHCGKQYEVKTLVAPRPETKEDKDAVCYTHKDRGASLQAYLKRCLGHEEKDGWQGWWSHSTSTQHKLSVPFFRWVEKEDSDAEEA